MFTPPFKGDSRNRSPHGRVSFSVPPGASPNGLVSPGNTLEITAYVSPPPGAKLQVAQRDPPGAWGPWSDITAVGTPPGVLPIEMWEPTGLSEDFELQFRYVDIATSAVYPFPSPVYAWRSSDLV